MIKRFDSNSQGRDFIAGDIHGCYDQLREILDRLDFDRGRDRLFCVGDLIDRGLQSSQALDWLAKPWFHSCLGNHEEMALTAGDDQENLVLWSMFNGGAWWVDETTESQRRFLDAFLTLPLAMEVETDQGRVGIVHADVPGAMSWPEFVEALEAGDTHARQVALWGRERAGGGNTTPVEGIDRVVCGHNINMDGQIRVVGNVWFIDTGAFLPEDGFGLTVLQVDDLFTPSMDSPGSQY